LSDEKTVVRIGKDNARRCRALSWPECDAD
jgi:hypothetical protein